MRASDGLAYWTVIGHPKVHTKIGFAANNQVSGPVWRLEQLEKISNFLLTFENILLVWIVDNQTHLSLLKRKGNAPVGVF